MRAPQHDIRKQIVRARRAAVAGSGVGDGHRPEPHLARPCRCGRVARVRARNSVSASSLTSTLILQFSWCCCCSFRTRLVQVSAMHPSRTVVMHHHAAQSREPSRSTRQLTSSVHRPVAHASHSVRLGGDDMLTEENYRDPTSCPHMMQSDGDVKWWRVSCVWLSPNEQRHQQCFTQSAQRLPW